MKRLIVIMIILAVALFLTGCEGKITGGGWFINECGEETKCTLGFNAIVDECGEVKGQFQFNDHFDTKIHAQVTGYLYLPLIGYVFEGEMKDGTKVYFKAEDNGEPGVDAGDYVLLNIGGLSGDFWGGYLGGGNIQEH